MDEPLIVVPLDGSPLAEGALPYARLLAEAAGGKLLLVTTWAGANGELQAVLPRVRASLTERAKRHYRGYLRTVADGLKRDGFAVETRFALGYPVDEIPALLRRRRPAYLVLATHGRSGLSRAWYGSVATRLVREASVPTLVVGPAPLRRRARRPSVRRILVPLDGTRLAEAALPHALDLAARLGASVTLAMVTRPAVYLFPTTLPMVNVQEIDRRLAETARDYLARVSERLSARAGKRRRVATVALRGLPADELLALIERRRFDLVVMTSHTRAGLARAVLGSVADRLLRGSAPVLLVRPETPARRRASRGRRR